MSLEKRTQILVFAVCTVQGVSETVLNVTVMQTG